MIPKIISAKATEDFVLEIEFDNYKIKKFSVRPYLNYTVFKPLSDFKFFKNFKLQYGNIVWGSEEHIDFDPYTLWTESCEV